jgi:hypothetical protein
MPSCHLLLRQHLLQWWLRTSCPACPDCGGYASNNVVPHTILLKTTPEVTFVEDGCMHGTRVPPWRSIALNPNVRAWNMHVPCIMPIIVKSCTLVACQCASLTRHISSCCALKKIDCCLTESGWSVQGSIAQGSVAGGHSTVAGGAPSVISNAR